jgi:hypothetical protein
MPLNWPGWPVFIADLLTSGSAQSPQHSLAGRETNGIGRGEMSPQTQAETAHISIPF